MNSLDDPQTTIDHGETIRSKYYLRNLYRENYEWFRDRIMQGKKRVVVEVGSGAGFIKEVIPDAMTSDILPLPQIDKTFSALAMPFKTSSVDALMMFNVLHHLKKVKQFFREAERCLKPGGKILMIEPANTLWSRFIYQHFHHEEFNPNGTWNIRSRGPLSGANGALPWIVFFRDRKMYMKLYPHLHIVSIRYRTPLKYLLSGGLSHPQFVPSWTYPIVTAIEKLTTPFHQYFAMFMSIEIVKRSD